MKESLINPLSYEESKKVADFIKKVEEQSNWDKCFSNKIINELYDFFSSNTCQEKLTYNNTIKKPLEIVLNYYKQYNYEYFKFLCDEIRLENIIISNLDNKENESDYRKGVTTIKLGKNDNDIFKLVHEFAHHLDIKKFHFIDFKYSIYGETISYYFEKKFEEMYKEIYPELIRIRKNNRLYEIKTYIKIIKKMLEYENHFKEYGEIDSILKIEDIDMINKKNLNNVVNTSLRYPIGYILAEYIIMNEVILIPHMEKILMDFDIIEIINKIKTNKDNVKISIK